MKEGRTQRTQKLLIMVGEEGVEMEGRDFKKLSEVVVETYLADKDGDITPYEEFLSEMLCRVVREVPLKQHIYAGLTAQIRKWNNNLGLKIVEKILAKLQLQLCNLNVYETINCLKFLAELMNISLLNSLSFFNIIDDLVTAIQNEPNQNLKQIFVHIFVRCLPTFAFSLNDKMFHDFKKLLERAKKYCSKESTFNYIFERQQKGIHTDCSLMPKLQTSFKDIQQIQINTKLNIKPVEGLSYDIIEYYSLSPRENDKLYQQFFLSEGLNHRNNIQQIIQTFKSKKKILLQKLHTYITNYRSSFMVRLVAEVLICKALKSRDFVIETSIMISLGKEDEDLSKSIEQIVHELFSQAENFSLDLIFHFSSIASSIITNWDKKWDWDKMVEGEEHFVKRKILLRILIEKNCILNDKFKAEGVEEYMPPENIKNQTKYKSVTDLETYENFVELLKTKADSEQVMLSIDSEGSYEIFLESLFERTSLSLTHLNILMNRYQGIFEKYQKEYDWTLITKIRQFWKKSLFHRILYLSFIIKKDFCKFDSYVKYIGKLQAETKEQEIWIKIELNELHKEFRNLLK